MLTQQDDFDWHNVVANAVGCEAAELKNLTLTHEEFPLHTTPRSMALEFNSSFNFVQSNWSNKPEISNGNSTVNRHNTLSIAPQTPLILSPDLAISPLVTTMTPRYNRRTNSVVSEKRYQQQQQQQQKQQQQDNEPSSQVDLILSPRSIYVPQDSKFFVIKSFDEVDVKTSFMHKVWSSTDMGNKRLNAAYTSRHSNERIFLFFSVNSSGKFCGIAEMVSPLIASRQSADLWMDKSRWRGEFKVQWLYVKDVYNSQLRHLEVPKNEFKAVTNSRDTQELPEDVGIEMLEIFKKTKSQTSFLQSLRGI